jgi:8-oxo-dGTP pyrophosphatase MutT (NUDIX family)
VQLDEFLARFQHPSTLQAQRDFPGLPTIRQAAVLVSLVVLEGELQVLFTRRSSHLKHHGGQVSFPGGKYEQGDELLVNTAIRETQEEIGVVVPHSQILGQLSNYPTISGFNVTPFIASIPELPELRLDENEVSDVFYVPLKHLANPQNYYIHYVQRQQRRYPVYFFPWGDDYIWGATAGMLINLALQLQKS